LRKNIKGMATLSLLMRLLSGLMNHRNQQDPDAAILDGRQEGLRGVATGSLVNSNQQESQNG
jgi:hypothetical protein